MILWFTSALALEPELDVHALVGMGVPETSTPVLVGAGTVLALPVLRPLHLELGGDFALRSQRGRWVDATAGVRGYLWSMDQPVVSVFANGGVSYEDVVSPLFTAGMALDLERQQALRPRISLGYAYAPADTSRLLVRVGAVFGRHLPDTSLDAAQVVTPTPVPPQSYSAVEPGMVWLPNPVCEWTPTDEATAEIERLGLSNADLSVVSARLLRAPDAPLVPVRVASHLAGPRPGRVVVATSDYDHVALDGEELLIDGGAGVGRVGAGLVWIEIVGGGRRLRFPLSVGEEHAYWLPVDPPKTEHLTFGAGSAILNAASDSLVTRLAENRGDWSYHVHGSYSEEGDAVANIRLAQRRAAAVVDALLARGVPPGAILVQDVAPPAPGLPPEKQRAAVVQPVEVP